jgi:hypothetical protein
VPIVQIISGAMFERHPNTKAQLPVSAIYKPISISHDAIYSRLFDLSHIYDIDDRPATFLRYEHKHTKWMI